MSVAGTAPRRPPVIARRVIVYLVLFSSVVTLVATSVQLYVDYRRDLGDLDRELEQLEASYARPLILAVWVLDDASINAILAGMLALPHTARVEIRQDGQVLYAAGTIAADADTLTREFPLVYRDGAVVTELGVLVARASLAHLYQRLLDRIGVILASNALKTFAVVLFVYIVFRRLVTRHLERIADYLTTFTPRESQAPLRLAREAGTGARDELDVVVAAVNTLGGNLHRTYAALAQSEADLRAHRDRLEERVAERTADVRRQAAILDQIHDAVVVTDMAGVVRSWNKGAERQYGYDAEEAAGRHIRFLFVEADPAAAYDRLIQPLLAQGAHETEIQRLRKNGAVIDLLLSLSLLRDDAGNPEGVVGYTIDISARTLAERRLQERTHELEATNRELETFSYSVSHDLRGPLRSIDGFCALLHEDYGHDLDETALDYLNRVRGAAHRMGHLIDDLLRLSRVSRSPVNRTQFDMSATVSAILEKLRESEPARVVRAVVTPGVLADADPGLVRIALENLLANAWKFTRHTAVAIIEFHVGREAGETVYSVRDNGAGFDMQYDGRLFRPFERLHTDGEFEGSGIGLAAVSRIVARHHGRIWAEAHPGLGACFRFTLSEPATPPS